MYTQRLEYTEKSADLFAHLVHLPYPVFFDSCFRLQNQGRYDILTADPIAVIDEEQNIFERIEDALAPLKAHTQNTHTLPFTVGAIGYLTYDIGRQLEVIPNTAKNDIAIPTALVGIYDWSIVIDHQEKHCYFTSMHSPEHPRVQTILNALQQTISAQNNFSLKTPFKSNMTKAFYETAFHQVKENIFAGNCYQVNLAQRFSAEFTGSPWQAYQLLRTKNPAPYAAFMQWEHGAILSVSPERFLKITGNQVETKPIKGTTPRFADPLRDQASADELCQSEKDRAENIMIVDLLRNDLSRSCIPGSVVTPKICALESFSNVHHLVSTIHGTLSPDHSSLSVFKNCFPGGSITGAPKIAAMKIIESLEPHRRSLYCGSLFYLDINGNFDSNIAIRTVICDDNKMHCYAGGGIVYDSECEKEYAETWAKVGKIIDALQRDI